MKCPVGNVVFVKGISLRLIYHRAKHPEVWTDSRRAIESVGPYGKREPKLRVDLQP